MKRLAEDVAFVTTATGLVQKAGWMSHALFDEARSRLVEGSLQLDLLNLWHATQAAREGSWVEHDAVRGWLHPKSLAQASYFGRLDIVEHKLECGTEPGPDDPVVAAVAAFVVTDLHVACVERLLASGVPVTLAQFGAHAAESVGSEHDRAIYALLVAHGKKAKDPAVRALATGKSLQR